MTVYMIHSTLLDHGEAETSHVYQDKEEARAGMLEWASETMANTLLCDDETMEMVYKNNYITIKINDTAIAELFIETKELILRRVVMDKTNLDANELVGSLWSIDGSIYIMACVGVNEYNFIRLEDGNRWHGTHASSEETLAMSIDGHGERVCGKFTLASG